MRLLASMALGSLVATLPLASRADDLDLQVSNKVPQGKGKPSLNLTAHAAIAQVQVDLEGGPAAIHETFAPLRPGQKKSLTLDPGEHPVHYTGTLRVSYPPKEGKDDAEMPLDFVAEIVRLPTLEVKAEDVDLAHARLTATFSRMAAQARVQVVSDEGQQLADDTLDLHGQPPGSPLHLEWSQGSGSPLKIHVQVTDPDGFYAGLDLFPWRVDIPHQEVGFASGSSAIPPAEGAKLDASLPLIQAAVKKAGRFAELRLYVAGHTDTVGAAADNQALSEARARAIGDYFRGHGVRVPIYYAGFGEKALVVPTPDATAEPRNRRAEYIVAITDPAIAHASEPGRWKKL
jgi:outer membrane protein OmpA-like peptidoglycan-associated protein